MFSTKRPSQTRAVVVALAVIGLAMSLATRALQLPKAGHQTTIHSISVHATQQHLDSDAAQWFAPNSNSDIPPVIAFYSRMSPEVTAVPRSPFDEVVCIRPPPSCSSSAQS